MSMPDRLQAVAVAVADADGLIRTGFGGFVVIFGGIHTLSSKPRCLAHMALAVGRLAQISNV